MLITKNDKRVMKTISLLMIYFTLFGTSVLSHGDKTDCSEECKSYYCPSENKLEKK